MGIKEDVFQMEKKGCKDQERMKMSRRTSPVNCQNEEGPLAWGSQLCAGQWQWTGEVCYSRKKFRKEKGEQKDE